MKTCSKTGFRPSARRTRLGFTFIELIVAVALTAILLQGMYTVFFAATDLARMSEEKMVAVLEAAAAFDSIASDVARSPYSTPTYTLTVSADQKSVVFQVVRQDGDLTSPVFVEYSLSDASGNYSKTDHAGTKLMRTVWKESARTTIATLATESEDGTSAAVARNISSLQVAYFDDAKSSVNDETAWIKTPDLNGTRTRALRFVFSISSPGGALPDQAFTQTFPILYN